MTHTTVYHTDAHEEDETNIISRHDLFMKLRAYSAGVSDWDVAVYRDTVPVLRLRSAILSNLVEKYGATFGDATIEVILLGFTQKEGVSIGEISVYIDWESVQYIEIIAPPNGQLTIIFQLGINESVTLVGII